jgi:hypothetical protein
MDCFAQKRPSTIISTPQPVAAMEASQTQLLRDFVSFDFRLLQHGIGTFETCRCTPQTPAYWINRK